MPSGLEILNKRQKPKVSGLSILERQAPVELEPTQPIGGDFRPTTPREFAQPDVTAVRPEVPVQFEPGTPEQERFLQTFSFQDQPTIGAPQPGREVLFPEPERELPGLQQAPERLLPPSVTGLLPTALQPLGDISGFSIQNPESKFFDLSPDEQQRFLVTQQMASDFSRNREDFDRRLEEAGFGDIDDPFSPFGSAAGFGQEFARGLGLEAEPAVEADPLAEAVGRFIGEGTKFGALIGAGQAAGLPGIAADIVAGGVSGVQRELQKPEFDPLAPLAEAAELGVIGGAFRTPGAVRRAVRGKTEPISELIRRKPVKPPVAPAKPAPPAQPMVAPIERPAVKPVELPVKPKVAEKAPEAVSPEVVVKDVRPQKPPLLPPQKPTVKPRTVAPDETIALNKAEIARIRKDVGLDKLPKAERKPFIQSLSDAKAARLDESALSTADEVLGPKSKPKKFARQITDAEHSGMVLKAGQLEDDFTRAIKDVSNRVKAGEDATIAQGRADAVLDQLDRLTRASDLAGRETARALSIRRLRITRETFSVASITQRARAKKGANLTPAESTRFKKQADNIAKLESEVKVLEADNLKALAENDRLIAGRVALREVEKGVISTKAQKARTRIATDDASIKKQLVELGFRVKEATGLGVEAGYLVGRLAINKIKQGAVTLDEVVRRVLKDVPGITERDVHQAINTRSPRAIKVAETETRKHIQSIKTQARLLVDIEKAERGIFKQPLTRQVAAPNIRLLQKRLTALRNEAYQSGLDGQRLERTLTKINELQDQLANGFRSLRKKRPTATAELATAQDKLREIRRLLNVEDNLADLNEQLRTKEFRTPVRTEPKRISPQLERKQVELNLARKRVRGAIEDVAPITPRRVLSETVNTLRTLKATADMSGTLRQGLILSARRPELAAKSFGKAFKATFNKHTAEQIDNAIRSADQHYIRERSKLFLADIGGRITSREETFMSRFLEKIPVIGPIVKASERNMATFLNLLRVGTFDDFLVKFPNATDAELKAWADWINIATGRGDLGRASAVATELSTVVFAPRFAVSRIQAPFRIFKNLKQPRVRSEIAKDMAAVTGLGMTTLSLGAAAGFDVGIDPRESDFGKMKVGNTRIDLWAGMQQPMRFLNRVALTITDKVGITGKELSDRQKDIDPLELLGRFAAYKLAPSVTVPLELVKGRTIVGEERTPSETAVRALMPLVYEDIADAFRDAGFGRAALVGGLTFLGVGATTFQDSESRVRRDISKLQRDGQFTAAFQKRLEWNNRHPDRPIRKVK